MNLYPLKDMRYSCISGKRVTRYSLTLKAKALPVEYLIDVAWIAPASSNYWCRKPLASELQFEDPTKKHWVPAGSSWL